MAVSLVISVSTCNSDGLLSIYPAPERVMRAGVPMLNSGTGVRSPFPNPTAGGHLVPNHSWGSLYLRSWSRLSCDRFDAPRITTSQFAVQVCEPRPEERDLAAMTQRIQEVANSANIPFVMLGSCCSRSQCPLQWS